MLRVFNFAKSTKICEIRENLYTRKLVHLRYVDETLSGNEHSEDLSKKLNRANGILAKDRHYAPTSLLKNIYHATFASNLLYGSQLWGQASETVVKMISILQKKSVRIMTFSDFKAHSNPIFIELKILKVEDSIHVINCLLSMTILIINFQSLL